MLGPHPEITQRLIAEELDTRRRQAARQRMATLHGADRGKTARIPVGLDLAPRRRYWFMIARALHTIGF